jgi:sugar/nucleoside kinase (ribokinase family)
LVALSNEFGKPLYVDSQVSQRTGNHRWYAGANLFCVNAREALTVDPQFDSRPLEVSLAALRETLNAENIVVKLGEKGCTALLGSELLSARPPHIQVRDTTGAGDAFFAVLSLIQGRVSESHLLMANTWAALSTTLAGAQPPTLPMLDGILRKASS